MPRKTIAGLEAEIERLKSIIALRDDRIRAQEDELSQWKSRPANVFLSYNPSGFPEVDAIHVVYRTLETLQDRAAQRAVAIWMQERYLTDDGG